MDYLDMPPSVAAGAAPPESQPSVRPVRHGQSAADALPRDEPGGEAMSCASESAIAVLRELSQVRMARDYDWRELQAVVKQLAQAGRDAELLPDQVLAIVRQLGDQAAMGEVSEWWRSILLDRIEHWCVAAYYSIDNP